MWPCGHLVFTFLGSRTLKEDISVILSHPACGSLLQQPEQIHIKTLYISRWRVAEYATPNMPLEHKDLWAECNWKGSNKSFLSSLFLPKWKVKVKSLSHIWLYTCTRVVHGLQPTKLLPPWEILQARILEWVAISFSRGSSRPRDRTLVSRIGGKRFNRWATREAWKEECMFCVSFSPLPIF